MGLFYNNFQYVHTAICVNLNVPMPFLHGRDGQVLCAYKILLSWQKYYVILDQVDCCICDTNVYKLDKMCCPWCVWQFSPLVTPTPIDTSVSIPQPSMNSVYYINIHNYETFFYHNLCASIIYFEVLVDFLSLSQCVLILYYKDTCTTCFFSVIWLALFIVTY